MPLEEDKADPNPYSRLAAVEAVAVHLGWLADLLTDLDERRVPVDLSQMDGILAGIAASLKVADRGTLPELVALRHMQRSDLVAEWNAALAG